MKQKVLVVALVVVWMGCGAVASASTVPEAEYPFTHLSSPRGTYGHDDSINTLDVAAGHSNSPGDKVLQATAWALGEKIDHRTLAGIAGAMAWPTRDFLAVSSGISQTDQPNPDNEPRNCSSGNARMSSDLDRRLVAKLDREFQAAVKVNDARTMSRILGKKMVLVLGNGTINTRDELLQQARNKEFIYQRQDEDPGTQTVRIWGDTAVITARLWVKGVTKGVDFDRHLWFSDVYIRTPEGWRYVFGQASLHLPGGV